MGGLVLPEGAVGFSSLNKPNRIEGLQPGAPGLVSENLGLQRNNLLPHLEPCTSNLVAVLPSSPMAPRLVELRRVLKESGSIYLHCDPTASGLPPSNNLSRCKVRFVTLGYR